MPDVVRHPETEGLPAFAVMTAGAGLVKGPLQTEASFDEFNPDIDLWYEGVPIELPVTRPPTPDELLSDDTAVARLSATSRP